MNNFFDKYELYTIGDSVNCYKGTSLLKNKLEIQLQDKFTSTDRFGDNEDFVAEYNRYEFDGGLRQDTRGMLN